MNNFITVNNNNNNNTDEYLQNTIDKLWHNAKIYFNKNLKYLESYDTFVTNSVRQDTILGFYELKAQFNRQNNNNNKINNDEIIFLAINLVDLYLMKNNLYFHISLFIRAVWQIALKHMVNLI